MRLLRLAAFSAGAFALAGAMSATKAQAPNGDWITIKGQVVMTKAPKPAPINVTVDKQHCLSKGPLVQEDIIVNPTSKGVKNVVVWLRPDVPDRKAPFPQAQIKPALVKVKPQNHVIDQPCCQFEPRVTVAREGDTIEFKNSAPVNHNVNYNSQNEQFNANMAPNTAKTTKPVKAESSPITFECNIHPWMKGRVRTFDHPYFAITDADGKFEIKDAPKNGKWKIVYWHEDGYHKGREGVLGFPLNGAMNGNTMELKPIDLELPK
jgi:plastocyanin